MPRDLRHWVSARVGHQSVVKEKGVRERVNVQEARVDRGGAASSGEAAPHERCHHESCEVSAGLQLTFGCGTARLG